ncbi:hypothetical protein Ancab_019996 [Ancistrocladus abbreviatus]
MSQDTDHQVSGQPQASQGGLLTFESKPTDYAWLKGSFTGVLKSSWSLSNILYRRLREVVLHCRFRHLGGRMVLLTVDGESDLATIIDNNGDNLSLWFEELQPWKKADIGHSRLASLRCSGVPLHVAAVILLLDSSTEGSSRFWILSKPGVVVPSSPVIP